MKILYVITGLGVGGAEKVVTELADQMLKRGHQVKIAYLKGEAIVCPQSSEIELIYLGFENLKSFRFAYQNYKKLIQEFQPDIVHAHMVHANIFARISRKFCPVPKLICTAHSNNEGGKARMIAYRLTHNWADLTTNVSESASKNFENLGAVPFRGIQTVYNGINLNKFKKEKVLDTELHSLLNVAEDDFLLLAVGRFHDAKDYPNLIRSFSYLKKSNIFKEKKPKLLIAGDGEGRSAIEQLIQNLKLESDVILLGRREDIVALLNMVDFFVLSSKYEGLPTVVIEAMACHTFVIATDCGGSAEIMGNTGILVQPQNSEKLAEALEKALSFNVDTIQKNNYDARNRVEKLFSLETSVKTWLEIYEK